MKFYQEIHSIYGELFPTQPAKINFLQESAPGPRVLDLAGGVGDDALALAQAGFQVSMTDGEEAMVEEARKKGLDAQAYGLLETPEDTSYDLVYCVGNSLVHLASREEIQALLAKTYRLLVPGGCLVLQIINFHPFLQEEGPYLGNLPLIENDRYRFERAYYRAGEKISFRTRIRGRGSAAGQAYDNQVLLYPLVLEDLVELLAQLGYQDLEAYSSWDQAPYDPARFPLILRCHKGAGGGQ